MKVTRVLVVLTALVLVGGLTVFAQASREPDHAPDYSNDYQIAAPTGGPRAILWSEDFEGGVPPQFWTTVDNEPGGSAFNWDTNGSFGQSNLTNGSGTSATACSDCISGEYDIELWTPVLDCSGASNLSLVFAAYYENFANYDYFEVDISTDGGSNWTNILSWNEDHGAENVNLDISGYADGAAEVMVRFHYFDPNSGDWDWQVQIDDVVFDGDGEVIVVEPESRAGIPALTTGGIAVMLLALAGLAVMILRRRA